MADERSDHPLSMPTAAWHKKFTLARKFKQRHFDDYAEEGMAFYTGFQSNRELYDKYMTGTRGIRSEDGELPELACQFVMAKVAELVQIFGPGLYHRNPVRTVTPRQVDDYPFEMFLEPQLLLKWNLLQKRMQQNPQMQQDPRWMMEFQQTQQQVQAAQEEYEQITGLQAITRSMAGARANLMSKYLNYTPNELDLKRHARRAIDEALIKGLGVLWCEAYQPYPGAPTLVGSFYDTVDNLLVDPDAEELEDALWVSRDSWEPVWKVARDFDIDEEYLEKHATIKSVGKQADEEVHRDKNEPTDERGRSNDLMKVTRLYSRMGFGDKLSGGMPELEDLDLTPFGDNVYLVLSNGIPYPLNLPSKLFEKALKGDEEAVEEAFQRVQWPIPFWLEGTTDPWPFTGLEFHHIPNLPWPMAHIRPGLPELKFLNLTTSALAEHALNTSVIYGAIRKGLEDANKQTLTRGGMFRIIEFADAEGKNINEMIGFATPPKGTAVDLNNINANINEQFDKRTGLTETMYATPGGVRSATEAQLKNEAKNIRPDDMANKVEDWMSRIARKEALAAQWLLDPEQDIAPVLGPQGAVLWERLIVEADVGQMALEFDYRIEAGTARKPNKETKQYNANQIAQVLLPLIVPHAQATGNMQPVNEFIRMWMEANDEQNPEKFFLDPPPPPQPDPSEQAKLSIEQMKAQAEQQKMQLEMQLKQLEMQIKQQTAAMDLAAQREKQQLEQQGQQMELAMDQQRFQMESQQSEREFEREHQQDWQIHQREMAQAQQSARQEMSLSRMLGSAKVEQTKQLGDQKVQQAKQMAKAKPKPQTQGSKK